MRRQIAIVGVFLFLVHVKFLRAEEPATRPAFDKQLVASANRFSIDYFKSLKPAGNNIVAPFSVYTFLSILREGVQPDGAKQFDQVLGIDKGVEAHRRQMNLLAQLVKSDGSNSGPTCTINSQLWLDKSVKPDDSFLAPLRDGYGCDTVFADFTSNPTAAAWSVNNWISAQTHGLLGDESDDILQLIKLKHLKAALANTIYFHASWSESFDSEKSKDGDFHVTPDVTVKVPMMHAERMLEYFHGDGVQLILLPYEAKDTGTGAAYEFVAILPDDLAGLAKLDHDLNLTQLDKWISSARLTEEKEKKWEAAKPKDNADEQALSKWQLDNPIKSIGISVPRFDIFARQDVRGVLGQMPEGDPLKSAALLPASGIARIDDWQIIHAARIIVDEKGTTATAATYSGLFGGPPPATMTLDLDHPFLYFIREKETGTILFMGQVCDPSKK